MLVNSRKDLTYWESDVTEDLPINIENIFCFFGLFISYSISPILLLITFF